MAWIDTSRPVKWRNVSLNLGDAFSFAAKNGNVLLVVQPNVLEVGAYALCSSFNRDDVSQALQNISARASEQGLDSPPVVAYVRTSTEPHTWTKVPFANIEQALGEQCPV